LLFSETEAAKQNQKFPFHFLSAPPTPPPAELNQKGRKIFGFCPRESASVSKAQSERKIKFRVTTRSARAISSFFQNKFAQRLVFLHKTILPLAKATENGAPKARKQAEYAVA